MCIRSGQRSGDHAKDTEPSGRIVRSFDSFVVLIDADGRQQMIYKHAISTVAPARPVSLELQG